MSVETLTGSKITCLTVLYLSFLFYDNNNSTTLKGELKFLPVWEMGKFQTLALNLRTDLFTLLQEDTAGQIRLFKW